MTNQAVNQFADVVDAATTADGAFDASKEVKGGFDKKPARAGIALFRLRSYIEVGQHAVKSGQGKGKKFNMAHLEFELVHPDHLIGPDDKKFPDTLWVRNLNVSQNSGSNYFKLFSAMDYDGKYTSFSQMLGHAFMGKVVHNVSGDKTYVNMREAGKDAPWLIGAPRYCADPINAPEAVTVVPVPEMHDTQRLFLFDNPGVAAPMVQKMWDSIGIVGAKDDGTPYKNWIQDTVREALNFEGSFVQSVVGGAAVAVSAVADEVAAATAAAATAEVAATGAVSEPDLVQPLSGATVVEPVDPLAGIAGL